jgi:ribulose-phosphate 3-epimerase
MTRIIPAILPHSYKGIEMGVEKIYDLVHRVQIDFVDGHFAPNRTWLFNNKDEDKIEAVLHEDMGLPFWDTLNYEFDLMVKEPIQHMDMFIAFGPAKVTFHLEGLDEEKTLTFFETLPEIVLTAISFGIAIGTTTDPDLIKPYLPYIESIQCMGIQNPGFQGQAFDERVYGQIEKVKAMYPDKTIAVDGAVSLENAAQLVQAGADELIIGSALFQNGDIRGTMNAFEEVCSSATTQSEN